MYVRSLHVQNVKLLRDVKIDFTNADNTPRMWTVFVGENRLCKTTLLQTIAAAAAGVDRGTQLVSNVIASWPDLRKPVLLSIDAEFEFPAWVRGPRVGFEDDQASLPPLRSQLDLEPDKRVFSGCSGYVPLANVLTRDPLTEARSRGLPGWFVAGYGPSRLLPGVGKAAQQTEPVLDRLKPLFEGDLIGTGFIELLGEDLGRAFAKVLQSVFIAGDVLPHITAFELRGRGGVRSSRDLVEGQRFEMDIFDSNGEPLRVPAAWLSQGYRTLIAWLADVVGQILLEAGGPVEAADMTGTVLVDEIDLHLHPTWQLKLIPALKRVFPKLQFIATTHSPMILSSLAADEVFILSQDADGSVVATQSPQSPALLTGSELFEAFFQLRKLYPGALGDKLHRYSYLATDPTRSDEEDRTMTALRAELEAAGISFDREPVEREP
jgi:hypothetical protein